MRSRQHGFLFLSSDVRAQFRTGLVKNYLIRAKVDESCMTKLKSGIVESICKGIIKTTDHGISAWF